MANSIRTVQFAPKLERRTRVAAYLNAKFQIIINQS